MNSLIDILLRYADQKEPVVYFYDRFKVTHSLTYMQIIEGSQRAASLFEQAVPGQCVLISLPSCPEFLFAFFGAILAGQTPVPMVTDEFMNSKEYGDNVRRLQAATQAAFYVGRTAACAGATCLTSLDIANAPLSTRSIDRFIDSASTCFIQFSSGSTQDPKGVVLTHQNVLANLEQAKLGMAIHSQDSLCSWLPLYHDMGLIGGLLEPLYVGRPVHLMNPVDFVVSPFGWLKAISKLKTTIMVAPDFAYRMCARKISAEQKQELDLSNIRLALSGAEPISARTLRSFAEAFEPAGFKKTAIFPTYGLAEATLAVTFTPLGQEFKTEHLSVEALGNGVAQASPSSQKRGSATVEIVSCGKPLTGVQIKIAAPDGTPLAERQIGRILMQSPSMTAGYFKNAKATSELFEEGWLVTGDLGYLASGELYVTGREKDLIILHGKNYHPADIERKVSEVQGYRMGRCAAVSYYHHDSQIETLQLIIECSDLNKKRRKRLQSAIAEAVSPIVSVTPQQVRVVPPCTLARTSSGKVKRYDLRLRLESKALDRVEKRFYYFYLKSQLDLYANALRYTSRKLTHALRKEWRAAQERLRERFFPNRLEKQLEAYLVAQLALVVEKKRHEIRCDVPFTEYALDSLKAFELWTQLGVDIAELPFTALMDVRNLDSLKTYLLENHHRDLLEWQKRRSSRALAKSV